MLFGRGSGGGLETHHRGVHVVKYEGHQLVMGAVLEPPPHGLVLAMIGWLFAAQVDEPVGGIDSL